MIFYYIIKFLLLLSTFGVSIKIYKNIDILLNKFNIIIDQLNEYKSYTNNICASTVINDVDNMNNINNNTNKIYQILESIENDLTCINNKIIFFETSLENINNNTNNISNINENNNIKKKERNNSSNIKSYTYSNIDNMYSCNNLLLYDNKCNGNNDNNKNNSYTKDTSTNSQLSSSLQMSDNSQKINHKNNVNCNIENSKLKHRLLSFINNKKPQKTFPLLNLLKNNKEK